MTTRIMSGKTIADAIKSEIAAEVMAIEVEHGWRPCLAAVRVGQDPASEVYVGNKVKTAAELGIISEHHHLPSETSHADLLASGLDRETLIKLIDRFMMFYVTSADESRLVSHSTRHSAANAR